MTTPRDPMAQTLREALGAEAPAIDEDALLARALDRAMAQTAPAAAASPEKRVEAKQASSVRPIASARPTAARSRVIRYALPIAAAFAASVAMGAIYTITRAPKGRPGLDPIVSSPPAMITSTPPAPTTAATDPRETAPTMSVDDLPNAAPPPSASALRAPAAPSATPAELFRDGNAARRSGDVDGAIDLYKSLVAHHAGTPEAHAARVSLGRLLLDRRGDAAGALAQFDAYLSSNASDRALAEEARVGRALVFLRQGRTQEERRAWQELLEKHPDSLHAARARERLSALAPASAPSP